MFGDGGYHSTSLVPIGVGSLGDKGGFPPVIGRSGHPVFVTLPREPQPLDACRTKGVFRKACEPLLIGYKPVNIERWGGGVH